MESYYYQAEQYFIGGQIEAKGSMKLWQKCGSINDRAVIITA